MSLLMLLYFMGCRCSDISAFDMNSTMAAGPGEKYIQMINSIN